MKFGKLNFGRRALCVAALWCVCSGVAKAEEKLSAEGLEALLPESTELLIVSQDVSETYRRLSSSTLCTHLAGKVWQTVREKQIATNTGSLINPKPWFGFEWSELESIKGLGALVGFRDTADEPCFILVVKKKNVEGKNDFTELWIKNQEAKSKLQVSEFSNSTKIYSPKTPIKGQPSICLAVGEEWAVLSNSKTVVEQLLQENGSNRAEASLWLKNILTGDSGSIEKETLSFWSRPWSVFSGATQKKEPRLFKSGERFGFDGVQELTGQLVPPQANSEAWKVQYQLKLSQPLKGGLAVFSFVAGPSVALPAVVNSAMDGLSVSYLDIKPWFQGVNHVVDGMIDEETPGSFGDVLDSLLTDPEGPKVDVRKELIYRMKPLMVAASELVSIPGKPDQVQHNQVWASELSDSAHTSSVLRKLFDGDEEVKSERIGQAQCWYTINDESLFVSLSKGESQTITMAAVDERFLYMATDTEWLKKLLAEAPSKKEEALEFDRLWNLHAEGQEESTFSMRQQVDLGVWLQQTWQRLPEETKDKKDSRATNGLALLITRVVLPAVTLADVPKWTDVQSALGVVSHSTNATNSGLEGQFWIDAKN